VLVSVSVLVVELVDVEVVVDVLVLVVVEVVPVVVVVVVGSVSLCKMPGGPYRPSAHSMNLFGHSTLLYLTFFGLVVQPHSANNRQPLANSGGNHWQRSICLGSARLQPAMHWPDLLKVERLNQSPNTPDSVLSVNPVP